MAVTGGNDADRSLNPDHLTEGEIRGPSKRWEGLKNFAQVSNDGERRPNSANAADHLKHVG